MDTKTDGMADSWRGHDADEARERAARWADYIKIKCSDNFDFENSLFISSMEVLMASTLMKHNLSRAGDELGRILTSSNVYMFLLDEYDARDRKRYTSLMYTAVKTAVALYDMTEDIWYPKVIMKLSEANSSDKIQEIFITPVADGTAPLSILPNEDEMNKKTGTTYMLNLENLAPKKFMEIGYIYKELAATSATPLTDIDEVGLVRCATSLSVLKNFPFYYYSISRKNAFGLLMKAANHSEQCYRWLVGFMTAAKKKEISIGAPLNWEWVNTNQGMPIESIGENAASRLDAPSAKDFIDLSNDLTSKIKELGMPECFERGMSESIGKVVCRYQPDDGIGCFTPKMMKSYINIVKHMLAIPDNIWNLFTELDNGDYRGHHLTPFIPFLPYDVFMEIAYQGIRVPLSKRLHYLDSMFSANDMDMVYRSVILSNVQFYISRNCTLIDEAYEYRNTPMNSKVLAYIRKGDVPSSIQYHDEERLSLTDELLDHENPDGFINPCGDEDMRDVASKLDIKVLSTLASMPRTYSEYTDELVSKNETPRECMFRHVQTRDC